ncbi:MAG: hypothetical protein KC983_11810 [Phycisphaerales bacterium]|nr:hypothetical protein [Phycisphaerales bacterium]
MSDEKQTMEDPKKTQQDADDADRRSVIDRRSGLDRRLLGEEDTNLERRRGPGRRRTDFMRSAEEGEMTQEQFNFVMAIEVFKRVNGKTFPTWTDVLEVIRKLGYRKTMASEINLGKRCEDWTERPDAASGVNKEADEESDE